MSTAIDWLEGPAAQPDHAAGRAAQQRQAELTKPLGVLDALAAEPLLHLGMRLGEGSGAAVAVPILRLACVLHNRMATFAEADVSACAC